MKAFFTSLFAVLVCISMSAPASAQRAFGAKTLTLDDGAGNTITIQTPASGWTGNIPFLIPIPPAGSPSSGFAYAGTAAGQILEWVMPNTTGPAPNNYAGGVQGSWQPTTFAAIGAITGTGTSGTIPIWTGASTQGNSLLTDNGTTLSYSGTHINSGTDYQIGGSTVLSDPGTRNIFGGAGAGVSLTNGSYNTLYGSFAGNATSYGSENTFIGEGAGTVNNSGAYNTFVGQAAGVNNLGGFANTSIGAGSGSNNTSGTSNTYLGYHTGHSMMSESNNTFVGAYSDGTSGISNATALGNGAVVSASNTIQLGNGLVTLVNTSGAITAGGAISGTTLTASTAASGLTIGSGANATALTSTATSARAISFPNVGGTLAISGGGSTYYVANLNPSGTTSSSAVQMGLGASITPAASGKVLLTISGTISNNTAGFSAFGQLSYGTGAAPANGAAATGNAIGGELEVVNPGTPIFVPFSSTAIVTGLAVGTTYWIDLQLAASGGGTAAVNGVSISAVEMP